MGTTSGAYELNNECASTSDIITRTRISYFSMLNSYKDENSLVRIFGISFSTRWC